MEAYRVDVLENIFNSTINIAFLGLSLSAKDVRYLDFFSSLFIILEEKVPTEGRLHVVNKGSLLVSLFFHLFLFFSAVRLLRTTVMKILIDDLFDIS
jgi:hypothetical protein